MEASTIARAITLAGLLFGGALPIGGESWGEPLLFFRDQIGLSDRQILSITEGSAVVKALSTGSTSEVLIFGAVFVRGAPEDYVKLAFDVSRLRQSASYLAVGRIGDPPRPSDFEGFTFEPDDIRHLRYCRPGRCGVQLPATAMHDFQSGLDWSAPNVGSQLNDRLREMVATVVRRYQQQGNSGLESYRDADTPFHIGAQLKSLLGRSEALPAYLPQLHGLLLDYPRTATSDLKSLFYWERVSFGLKTTLRLNHVMAFQSSGPRGPAQVVAVKQLFASHYLQLALDLSVCVRARDQAGNPGFYLISLIGSTQSGLTGWRGSLVRRIVVSRTRSSQEKVLINIKQALEAGDRRNGH